MPSQLRKASHDWTNIYNFKVEEDNSPSIADLVKDLNAYAGQAGCDHDHSAEERIFEMVYEDKIASCTNFIEIGNMFFEECLWQRALDRYRRALIYYEYAFPDEEEEQAQLDQIRLQCLLNSAACSLRLSQYPDCVNFSSQALDIDPQSIKALYRRIVAYRELGNYEESNRDLQNALSLSPNHPDLLREMELLRTNTKHYISTSSDVAIKMLNAQQQ